MRHVSAALVVAAIVVGSARADGPAVSLKLEVPRYVVPSGHHFFVGLRGSIPEGSAQLWAFVRHGRVLCSGTPYEEQGTPIVSGTTFQGGFIVDALLRRHELGPYTVCAYLGYSTARAVFRIGPPELRALGIVVTRRQGRSADRPGATLFHLTGSRQARADLRVRWQGGTVSRVRARLGRNGARSLRVPWSCARVGEHRYSLTVRDRYGNSRARSGSFRTESCVGLRGFFIWPLRGFITSYFGYAERGRLHDGIDIDDNLSSVIRAAAWGRVTSAGWSDGYGNLTLIDHGDGFVTFYGHQSRIFVHSGQQVRRGQVIGIVGCTGSCTGTHLHFGMHVHGASVNPLRYLRR
jgi:hypothetical protein